MTDNTGQAVKRTLAIMRAVATFKGEWFGLGDMALRAGLPNSTTHRYLAALVEENVLEANEIVPGKYRHKRA